MKIHDPEWAATVALIRAAEGVDAVQHRLWNDLGRHIPRWSEERRYAYHAMTKARIELREEALKAMPPGGTSDDYADIVLAVLDEGTPT